MLRYPFPPSVSPTETAQAAVAITDPASFRLWGGSVSVKAGLVEKKPGGSHLLPFQKHIMKAESVDKVPGIFTISGC